MEKVYIQPNLVNLVTIVLMAAVGFAVAGTVVSFLKTYLPQYSGN